VEVGEVGPIDYSLGPLQYPFACQTDESRLGPPLIDNYEGWGTPVGDGFSKDCLAATQAKYYYKPSDSDGLELLLGEGTPENMTYVTNLASAYMLQGDFRSAATNFQKAIFIAPTKSTYSSLGLMYYYMDDFEAAIESHNSAVELQPNDYLARANLGDVLWAAGRTEEARRAFQDADRMAASALQVNPNDPLIIMDLAWIKTCLEDHDEARRLIDRALDLVPEDPYVHYINGLMLNRSGNTSQAFASFETAVDLGYSKVLLAGDPNITNLRGDSRFSDIANGTKERYAKSPKEERQ